MSEQNKKDCRKIQELFSSYLDGQLETVERDAVRFHIEICPSCRYELQSMRITKELLHRMPVVPAPRSFTLAEAPKQHVTISFSLPNLDLNWLRMATAAAAVIFALLMIVDFSGVLSEDSTQTAVIESPTSAPAEVAGVPTPAEPIASATAGAANPDSWDAVQPEPGSDPTPTMIGNNVDTVGPSNGNQPEEVPEARDPMSEREVLSPPPPSLALFEIAAGVLFLILGSLTFAKWQRKRSLV